MNLLVKFNEKAFFEEGDLTLHFQEVLEDSRCPVGKGVACVWEGNAKILLSVSQAYRETLEVTLNTFGRNNMLSEAKVFEYSIKLDSLFPVPSANINQPDLQNYVATLAIAKTSSVAN